MYSHTYAFVISDNWKPFVKPLQAGGSAFLASNLANAFRSKSRAHKFVINFLCRRSAGTGAHFFTADDAERASKTEKNSENEKDSKSNRSETLFLNEL